MDVSKEIYDAISALPPDSASVVGGMLFNEVFHAELGDYDISKSYADFAAEQVARVKPHLIRSFVSKRLSGEDIDSIVYAVEALAKAEHKTGFQSTERRDSHGRWTRTIDDVAAVRTRRGNKDINNTAFVPEVVNLRRVRAAADVLTAVSGAGFVPGSAGVAAAIVGQSAKGLEVASPHIIPAWDKHKLRYQGTERKLDPQLVVALREDHQQNIDTHKRNGGRPTVDEQINHVSTGQQRFVGRPGEGKTTWVPSQTIRYFQNNLPKENLSLLQRVSGHIPPSQGIIIDHAGHPSAQMHGVEDDHFVPFNSKSLGTLKGGVYIRSRTNGGLTTEDIYTGLMSGARGMTVVSHNGVFNLEFDPTLRGSRRYSQTARQMTDRYGQLLDAVKNGEIRINQVDPSVRRQAWEESGGDQGIYQNLLKQAVNNPQPTPEMIDKWGDEFLDGVADNYDTGSKPKIGSSPKSVIESGSDLRDQVARQIAPKLAAQENAAAGIRVYDGDEEQLRTRARSLTDNTAIVAEELGVDKQYRTFLANKADAYAASLRPISLNGQGYSFAQDALKEQFPYFIKNVAWQPLDSNPAGRGNDAGYVKPRFLRPAGTQAGYVDPSINGSGKVGSDTIRFQNWGVMRHRDSFESGGRTAPEREKKDAERTPEPGTTTAPAASPARAAALNYAKSLAGAPRFSTDITLEPGGGGIAYGGQATGAHRAVWLNGGDDGKGPYEGFNLKPEDFDRMSDSELQRVTDKMHKTNEANKMFDVDPELRSKFLRGGKATQLDADLAEEIDPDFDEELDFDTIDPSYNEKVKPGKPMGAYRADYNTLPGAKHHFGEIEDENVSNRIAGYISDEQDKIVDNPSKDTTHNVSNIARALLARKLHARFHESKRTGGGQHEGSSHMGGLQGLQQTSVEEARRYGILKPDDARPYPTFRHGSVTRDNSLN